MELPIGPRGVSGPQLANDLAALGIGVVTVNVLSRRLVNGAWVRVTPYVVVPDVVLSPKQLQLAAATVSAERPS